MTYATELVQRYRKALQYLWNAHFWWDQTYRDIQAIREFEELKLPLFTWLVAKRLGPDFEVPEKLFGDPYKVVPKVTGHIRSIRRMLVEGHPGIWEELKGEFKADELTLTLLDFFDWDVMNWRDFRFYRVRIDHMAGRPEKVGREALIDVLEVDVLWEPPGIVGLPSGLEQPPP
jgi:hypothetical protein